MERWVFQEIQGAAAAGANASDAHSCLFPFTIAKKNSTDTLRVQFLSKPDDAGPEYCNMPQ